jgi:membrane peptidoglycan carboxypeptidase
MKRVSACNPYGSQAERLSEAMNPDSSFPPAPPDPRRPAQAYTRTQAIDNPALREVLRREEVRRGGCFAPLARLLLVGIAVGLVLACVGTVVAAGTYFAIASSLPPASQLSATTLTQSTKIYDRNGGLLYEIFDPQSGRRTVVPPDKIPEALKQATIATEDPSFYTNLGVDPRGIARAIYYDYRYGRIVTGGSTITQQLVKNVLLTPEPTFQRKIREAVLALEATRRYSKDQILAMYLNAIYYGNLSYGIEAASQSYFKKDVSQLDLAEASLLAGLPQAPSRYDPCLDPDAALVRQQTVLRLMAQQGYITSDQANAAATEMDQRLHNPDFSRNCAAGPQLKSPHFCRVRAAAIGGPVRASGGLQGWIAGLYHA